MGTVATLRLPASADPGIARAVQQLLHGLQHRLTVNNPTAQSQVAAINAAAGGAPVGLDADVYDLVRIAVLASVKHRDSFNALLGPVTNAWRIGFPDARVPLDEELAALLALTDPRDVELDDGRRTVRLTRPGMRLDLGAIAKGYAADRAAELLRVCGIDCGLIDLGGNVVALGGPDENPNSAWRVGIQAPFQPRGTALAYLRVRDGSAVTSGVYERHLGRHHHMIDPLTGRPFETELASVTVVSCSSLKADLWASIAQRGLEPGLRDVTAEDGVEAVFVCHDGRLVATDAESAFPHPLTNP